MIEGQYTSQFVGRTKVELSNQTLKFSGIKKWPEKTRLIYSLVIIVVFYYGIVSLIYRLSPASWLHTEQEWLGIAALALLILLTRNQFEVWFHKNEKDRISLDVPLNDISSVELTPRKTNMIVVSKNKQLLQSGRFVVKQGAAGDLEKVFKDIQRQLSSK